MVDAADNTPCDAVVLLSGGLDSAVTLALARHAGLRCAALSFEYGQRHHAELAAANRVAQSLGVDRHLVVPLDLRAIGGSALTADIMVPKDRAPGEMNDIPITYVPARNLIFLSIAAGYSEVVGARSIHLGVNAVDYSGYPDCRPAFIESFAACAKLATKVGVEGRGLTIQTPLIALSKVEIIRTGVELGVDFSLTHSCYDPAPTGEACGHCDSCLLRKQGFADAGVPDPTRYAK